MTSKPKQNGTRPRREYREFKFIVTPVLLLVDEDGSPVAEQVGEPMTLYKLEGVRAMIDRFDDDLAELNEQLADLHSQPLATS